MGGELDGDALNVLSAPPDFDVEVPPKVIALGLSRRVTTGLRSPAALSVSPSISSSLHSRLSHRE